MSRSRQLAELIAIERAWHALKGGGDGLGGHGPGGVAGAAGVPGRADLREAGILDRAIDRALDRLEREIARKSEGNPYHEKEGHFTNPAGVGHAAGEAPSKRLRKKRKKRKTRKPGAHGHKSAKVSGKSAGHSGAGGGGGNSKTHANKRERRHTPNQKEALDRLKKGKPAEYVSEKARRAAESQNKTDGKVQAYTKNNEHELAKKLGGRSYPDNQPADVDVTLKDGSTRGVELKTVTHGANDKITMKADAIARKVEHQEETGRTMYTVIEDHRDTFDGGANKALYSGNRLYLRIGTGSYRIGNCVPIKDHAQLREYLEKTPDELIEINPKFAGETRGTNR